MWKGKANVGLCDWLLSVHTTDSYARGVRVQGRTGEASAMDINTIRTLILYVAHKLRRK